MSAKLFKIYPNFCETLLKKLDFEKFRTAVVNIAKTHILLVKTRHLW